MTAKQRHEYAIVWQHKTLGITSPLQLTADLPVEKLIMQARRKCGGWKVIQQETVY